MGESFRLLPTPNAQELIFATDIPVIKLTPDFVATCAGKTLEEFLDVTHTRGHELYKDFVFMEWGDNQRTGHIEAFFGAPKSNDTDASALPAPFEITTQTEDFTWPAVMKALYSASDVGAPYSLDGVTRARLFFRPVIKQRQTLGSKVKVEKFLSNRPFPESFFRLNHPQPTEVSWNFTGVAANSILCLHDDITIKFKEEVKNDSHMKNPTEAFKEARFFPKTNYLDWSRFVLRVASAQRYGMYYYERHTIFPPAGEVSFT